MAGMRRQKQYDMFDVATGTCELEDYLNQRYSENDLSSSFWIEKDDEVDELRAPKLTEHGTPGTEPVVIPIQGPNAPKPETGDHSNKDKVLSAPTGLEPDGPAKPDQETVVATVASSSPTPDSSVAPSDGKDVLQGQAQVETPALETVQLSDESPEKPEVQPEPAPPDMQALLAKFHQAAQEYQVRSAEDPAEES